MPHKREQHNIGWRTTTRIISTEVFRASLLTYFLFLILEELRTGFVIYHINMHILLTIVFLSGFLAFLMAKPEEHEPTPAKSTLVTKSFVAITALAVAITVYFLTRSTGTIALVIAALAGVVVVVLAVATRDEPDETLQKL